jgi:hypothetical protein
LVLETAEAVSQSDGEVKAEDRYDPISAEVAMLMDAAGQLPL